MAFIYPDADDILGAWTASGGGTTNIYQEIDESTTNDSDYIKVATPSTYRCTLQNPSVTPDPGDYHLVRMRFRFTNWQSGDSAGILASLVDISSNATIATIANYTAVHGNYIDLVHIMSASEIDACQSTHGYDDLGFKIGALTMTEAGGSHGLRLDIIKANIEFTSTPPTGASPLGGPLMGPLG